MLRKTERVGRCRVHRERWVAGRRGRRRRGERSRKEKGSPSVCFRPVQVPTGGGLVLTGTFLGASTSWLRFWLITYWLCNLEQGT